MTGMASILVRQVPDSVKAKLKAQAARHGRSMEEEVRDILACAAATGEQRGGRSLAEDIHALFAPFGGVELPEVPDEPVRDPPDFT